MRLRFWIQHINDHTYGFDISNERKEYLGRYFLKTGDAHWVFESEDIRYDSQADYDSEKIIPLIEAYLEEMGFAIVQYKPMGDRDTWNLELEDEGTFLEWMLRFK